MEIFIKNMVCTRCIMIVKLELEKIDLPYHIVELGKISTKKIPTIDQLEKLRHALINSGLELLDNKKNILVEKIKNVVFEMVYYSESQLKIKFSEYLSSKLNFDYTYLANIFSEVENMTIEQLVIRYRIQRVKELICYQELNLTEISWELNYSSVAHLSSQFKKVTGITPSQYKHHPSSPGLSLVNV